MRTLSALLIFCFAVFTVEAQFHPDLVRHSEWQETTTQLRNSAQQILARIEQANKAGAKGPAAQDWDALEHQILIQDLMLQGLAERVSLDGTRERLEAERQNLAHVLDMMAQPAGKQAGNAALVARLHLLTNQPAPEQANGVPLWGLAAPDAKAGKQIAGSAPPVAPKAEPTRLADQVPNSQRLSVPELLQWMQRNVAYTPYYGSYRLPNAVLQDGVANDADGAQFLAALLRELQKPVRFVQGRVRVEMARLQSLLKTADAGATANVLTAAEIPFEAVVEDNAVVAFDLDRVWLEVYVPIAAYRGVATGKGDHAWVAIDPMFHALQTPSLDDPFADQAINSTAMLNAYERANTRDALFWVEQQLGALLDTPLHMLREGYDHPTPRQGILELSLPYEVLDTYGTFDSLPEALYHQVAVRISDGAGLELASSQQALASLYSQPLVWDAIGAEPEDTELIETLGGRFEVPAHLLEVRATFGPRDGVWLLTEHGVPMGAWLQFDMTVTTPGGTVIETSNQLRAGGFSLLVMQGDGHPLRPFQIQQPEANLDPFGEALFQMTQGYLQETQNQEARLAQSMRVWSITPAPHQAWAHLRYTPLYQDGEISSLELDAIRLDAEVRATRPVAATSGHSQERSNDFLRLSGLIAAQNESLALERLHEDVDALSVPDLFNLAWQSAVEPVALAANSTLDGALYGLPEAIAETYQSYLDRGFSLRFLASGMVAAGKQVYAARIADDGSGRTAWLLDHSEAGGLFPPTPAQKDGLLAPARYPGFDAFPENEEVAWIVAADHRIQLTTADQFQWRIRYRVLNSNGRPIKGARIKMDVQTSNPKVAQFFRRATSYSDANGVVTFRKTPMREITASPYLSTGNGCSDPEDCEDSLKGIFTFMPYASNGVTPALPHHVVVDTGPLAKVRLQVSKWESSGRSLRKSLANDQNPIGHPRPFRVLALDAYGNFISNEYLLLDSEYDRRVSNCVVHQEEIMRRLQPWRIPTFNLSGFFYTSGDFQQSFGSMRIRTSVLNSIHYYVPGKVHHIPNSCNSEPDTATNSIMVSSESNPSFKDSQDLEILFNAPGPEYYIFRAPGRFDDHICLSPQRTCYVERVENSNGRASIGNLDLPPDFSICDKPTAFHPQIFVLHPNGEDAITLGETNNMCISLGIGLNRENGVDVYDWPKVAYNLENHENLQVPIFFAENKLVSVQSFTDPPGNNNRTRDLPDLEHCAISVPCDLTSTSRYGDTAAFASFVEAPNTETSLLADESGNFFLDVTGFGPQRLDGWIRFVENLTAADNSEYFSADENRAGTTPYLPFIVGLYQVDFDHFDVAPMVLSSQNKLRNRIVLNPKFLPGRSGGRPFASEKSWSFRILSRPKINESQAPGDQYYVVFKHTGQGTPYAEVQPGFKVDPDYDYFLDFAYDLETSVDDPSPVAKPEGANKFFQLRVEQDPDLLLTDFEDHALFLDQVPPATSGKRLAEDCYRPPTGPYLGFPVLPQRVFHFLGKNFSNVRLQAFLEHPRLGGSPLYDVDYGELNYDAQAVAPSFPIESPEPLIVSPVPLENLNGLYWRLVGTNNGIAQEGEPTFLRHRFLVGGAGVVDQGNEFRTTYIPEYTFEFDEDPSGETDNACLFIQRDVGFSLNKEARVTFLFDGQLLVDEQVLAPGDYAYPVEMGFMGRKDWALEATFWTEGGGATGGRKEVTLTRQGFLETRRRINNKLNIGSTSVKGVNLVTGSLTLSHTDFAMGGVGQGVQFSRTYNNTAGENYSPMGHGWTHNYQSRLVVSGCNDLTIVGGDGSGMAFRQNSSTNEMDPLMPGIHGDLVENSMGGYTYRTKSGTRWIYGPPIDPQNVGLTHPRYYSQNLIAVVDPYGNATTFEYNSQNGYLETVRISDGRGLNILYADQDGRILISGVQTQGISPMIRVNYTYDAWGRLLSAERGEKLETYGYPDPCDGQIARNNIIAYTNGNSQTTTYTYQTEDPSNEFAVDVVTAIQEPEGRTYTFSYADGGEARTATVSDGLATTNYTFDLRGRPTEIAGPLGTKSMTWAEDDVLLEEETNEAGQTITYKYDDNGNMTERSVNGATELWQYDTLWNKPISYTDRLGNETTWELSVTQGHVKSMTDAEQGETRYEVDARGLVTSVTDPNGNETKTSYDIHGYPVSVALPDDTKINRSFDSRGRLLSEEQPGGRTTYAYNDLDHLEEQASAVEGGPERVVRFGGLQPLGQPATKTDGQLQYTYAYDQLNRVVSETMSPGQGQPTVSRSMTYNVHDLVTRETMDTRGGNRTYNNTYDAAGRLLSQTLNGESYRRMTYRNGTKLLLSETDYTGAITRYTYDGLLNLTSRTLATGQTEQYVHDANGNLVNYTDGDGRSESYAYDKLNRQISMTNKVGHDITSEFDANGNLLSRANGTTGVGFQRSYDERNRVVRESVFNTGGNQTTSISYSNGGLTVRTTPPEDAAITERYNMLGDLISREQNGITTGYTYDANGGVVEVRHPMGYTTTYERDGLGRPIRANLPEGYRESWDYDGYGNALSHTDRRGVQVETTYDTYNRPLSRSYTSDFGDATEAWSYSQSNGEVTVDYTDMRGHTTTQVLDAFQRVLSIEDPLRGEATNTYSAHNRTASVDFNGNSYTYRHDGLDRLLSRVGPGGALAYAYLDGSNQVSITDRRGINTFEQYDQAGNLLSRRVGETTVESHTYDKQNRPVQSVDGSGITTARTYDALGRLLTETTGPETTTFSGYDDLGRPASISDGRSTNGFTYDFYGRTLTRTNGEGAVTTMTYDAVGNMLTREVPGPAEIPVLWAYQYNLLNQVSKVEDPLGNATTLTWSGSYTSLTLQDAAQETSTWNYDPAGRLTSMQRPGLGTITYQYDGNDNQVAIAFPDSSAELTYDHNNLVINESWEGQLNAPRVTIERERDANGNLTAVTHTSQGQDYTRTLTYDHLNRPTMISDSDNLSVTIGYNGNGTRSSLALPSGLTMSYAYDAANRLTDVTVPGQGTTSYSYTNNGLVSGIDYANGMNATFDYDLASRPVLADYLRTGGERTTFSATYFADGSRESLTEDRGALGVWQTQYVYDDALRLAGFTRHTPDFERTTTYELDGVGNRISEAVSDPTGYSRERRYDLGAGHRVMGFSETVSENQTALIRNVTYRYDGNGNRVQKIETEDGITTNHEMDWDARNRMVRLEENGSPKLTMYYDDLDRRIRKIGDERGDIRYVWNQLAVLEEYEDLGQMNGLLASYTYGLERLTMNRVGGSVYTYTYDLGGSAADLVASNGMLVQAQTYTPFGTMEKIVETGFGGFNRLGFSGHEWDPESELTYAKHRFYDQDLGVFTSQDPVLGDFGTPPSLHRYMYAFHNPTRFYDPDGRRTKTQHEKQEELEQQAAKDSQGYNLDEGFKKLKETGEDVVRVGTVILENGAELTVVGDVKTLTSEDESALSKTLATANVAVIVIGGVGYVATKFLADGLIHLRKVDDAVDLSKVNKLKRLKKVGEATDAANDPSVQRLQKLLGIGKYRKGKSTATQSVTKTENAASTSTAAMKSGSNAADTTDTYKVGGSGRITVDESKVVDYTDEDLKSIFSDKSNSNGSLRNGYSSGDSSEIKKLEHKKGDRRLLSGVASYSDSLPDITSAGDWLKGSHGNAGKIPLHIAKKLAGRNFNNFDEFRRAFWTEVGYDPILSSGFSKSNQKNMKNGWAPTAVDTQQVGKRIKYELDHNQEIQYGGNVYDMDNIIIRTPLNHIKGK